LENQWIAQPVVPGGGARLLGRKDALFFNQSSIKIKMKYPKRRCCSFGKVQ
jgi:hypothetical protein